MLRSSRPAAQRVSVGGALAWVAIKAMAGAAQEIRDTGDFSSLAARLPLKECSATSRWVVETAPGA